VISVILTASTDAEALARLLSALVPGAAEGLVREVAVIGAVGASGAVADEMGADLFEAGGFAEAFGRARHDWVAGLPLGAALTSDWIERLAVHVSCEPPSAARLVAGSGLLSLGFGAEGWLVPKGLAPSAAFVEQDLQRLARRSGVRLRILGRL
jgi:hypothetical protein